MVRAFGLFKDALGPQGFLGLGAKESIRFSDQAGASGAKLAPVIATSRPPGASRASAERRCRAVASVVRPSTLAIAENGGFIRITLGRNPASR